MMRHPHTPSLCMHPHIHGSTCTDTHLWVPPLPPLQAVALERVLPSLTELHLAGNAISHLSPTAHDQGGQQGQGQAGAGVEEGEAGASPQPPHVQGFNNLKVRLRTLHARNDACTHCLLVVWGAVCLLGSTTRGTLATIRSVPHVVGREVRRRHKQTPPPPLPCHLGDSLPPTSHVPQTSTKHPSACDPHPSLPHTPPPPHRCWDLTTTSSPPGLWSQPCHACPH